MLQSNFPNSPLSEPDQFSLSWPLQEQSFISNDTDFPYNDDDALSISTFDFNSNSSDIDHFNFEEFECSAPVTDAFVSSVFGEAGFSDFECLLDNLHNQSSLVNNLNSCSETSENEQSNGFTLSCTKSWSGMTSDEQRSIVLSLSTTVCKMGIDEQLEIIKIIDPDTQISSDMKEFTIDVSLITDAKWKRIQYICKKHMHSLPSQETSMKARKACKASKALARKSNFASRTSKKPKQKKQISERERIKLKHERQGRKEERSGLFVYEKVVKFTSLDEDEDVNILE